MFTIYTIGHSTRTIEQFIELLKAHDIEELVDVRTIPKSRHNPQFGAEELAASLQRAGIAYTHLAIMCAEAVPWRCHRSLIADALTVQSWQVLHIQSRKTASHHELTSFLKVQDGKLTYPEP